MSWREQYDRMKRWQQRLWLDPILHDEHAVDSFYSFAQACYHLVDWLENDRSQHVRRAQAEEYVDRSPVLAFCRDICNGSKHARLEAKKVQVTIRKEISSYSIENDSGQTTEHTVEQTKLFVGYDDQLIDVEMFAGFCVEEWDRFLLSEKLLG